LEKTRRKIGVLIRKRILKTSGILKSTGATKTGLNWRETQLKGGGGQERKELAGPSG